MKHEYSVELRIYGKDLNVSEVTRDLGFLPSLTVKAGERVGNKQAEEALWSYNGSESDEERYCESLEDGLEKLLKTFWPVKEKIARYKLKFGVIWWCGHFQSGFDGGPTLSSSILQMLGEFGVDLFIDNYFNEED